MSTQQRFSLLRKLLKALGLSDVRVEELIGRIQEWLLDDQAKKWSTLHPLYLRSLLHMPADAANGFSCFSHRFTGADGRLDIGGSAAK